MKNLILAFGLIAAPGLANAASVCEIRNGSFISAYCDGKRANDVENIDSYTAAIKYLIGKGYRVVGYSGDSTLLQKD